MKIQVTVCDTCQDAQRPTTHYSITRNGDPRQQRDLCEEHAAPIEELLGKPSKSASRAAPARRPRRNSTPRMTLEEIEQAKAASR